MMEYALPVGYTLLVWWLSTGLVLFLDGLPRATFRWSMLGASAMLGVALYGLVRTSGDTTVAGAYLAFTCGVLAWGWQEMGFLMGFLTGPRKQPCASGCNGWRHFGHGIQALLYHELAIVGMALAIVAITWGGPNQVGTWTFLLLWAMRQSAKLNLFLGVRNLSEEFLPDHLKYLAQYFRKAPMNLLFPVSVTVSTVIAGVLVDRAAASAGAFESVGCTLLATLLVLAILEHWLLVLPLSTTALWSWGLRSRGSDAGEATVELGTDLPGEASVRDHGPLLAAGWRPPGGVYPARAGD
jgi:putative photosynthetic complex assembly protein 2